MCGVEHSYRIKVSVALLEGVTKNMAHCDFPPISCAPHSTVIVLYVSISEGGQQQLVHGTLSVAVTVWR